MAGEQINNMMKKMDLQSKVKGVLNSDALKGVAQQAVALGVIDAKTQEMLENKALLLA